MRKKIITSMEEVKQLQVSPERKFYSAEHDEISSGATTDIYFVRTYEILKKLGKVDTIVTAEIFARRSGILCGVNEVLELLKDKNVEIWSLSEGSLFEPKEVLLRIKGPYSEFGIFETSILGMLASSSGWATASWEIKQAAGEHTFVCFGARHLHPAVAPVMERAAIIGGASGASCILGAKLAGREPRGTVPHAIFLIIGDTVEGAKAYDRYMPPEAKRIILVDTFKDEAEEALRVAKALGPALEGVRLDTASERGGVSPELVREVRYRLDLAGFKDVAIFVSGGLTPERIPTLIEAGASAFGVGSYISAASPIDMTMDLKEVDGKPIAKRGRLPGIIHNSRLKKVK
ncbi:MAG: nicotinate phosphoribosyltransferase [Clostridia bacterium]|nr:nicotinate phosphoribosyltransferase [Clostridia bacterium]